MRPVSFLVCLSLGALSSGCAVTPNPVRSTAGWPSEPIAIHNAAPASVDASASAGSSASEDSAPQAASSGVSTEDMNKSNNPLNPALSINLQDYYSPELYGVDGHTNDALLRAAMPIPAGFLPTPQLIRATLPISTRPNGSGDEVTGLGDFNIFDIFLLGKVGEVGLGVGPLLTIPTATKDATGTDLWQAGLAAIAIESSPAGLFGGLIQWQTSFAGPSSAGDVSTFTLQPFVIYNLPAGWYLRSTGIWSFDLEHGNYYIPVGLGGGAIWKQGGTTFNAFIEPQFTIAHDGSGAPQFTIFFGINTTLG